MFLGQICYMKKIPVILIAAFSGFSALSQADFKEFSFGLDIMRIIPNESNSRIRLSNNPIVSIDVGYTYEWVDASLSLNKGLNTHSYALTQVGEYNDYISDLEGAYANNLDYSFSFDLGYKSDIDRPVRGYGSLGLEFGKNWYVHGVSTTFWTDSIPPKLIGKEHIAEHESNYFTIFRLSGGIEFRLINRIIINCGVVCAYGKYYPYSREEYSYYGNEVGYEYDSRDDGLRVSRSLKFLPVLKLGYIISASD
jgi:hypothetical protein